MSSPRAITIAILAMGGEGGGVLAEWLIDLAERNGFLAQSTSVPGVAQRTGATIYYLELFPEAAVPAGRQPVLALGPVPGEVDIVIASELMEAGRALQRGLVSADRTTLVASTHRVYSMTERTAMGDGRVDADKLLAGCRTAAARFVAADFARVAEDCGSPISPALYGALAATARLPFDRKQFEETIVRGGVGVQASLAAFAAGFDQTLRAPDTDQPTPRLGPRLAELRMRIESQFPAATHATLAAAVLRLADYQDPAYAAAYLDRLAPLAALPAALPAASPSTAPALAANLLDETARHLALWMSYEDAVRVADLKTRRARFERVAKDVRARPDQIVQISEFMHPRVEEIADVLPARAGRWLLATGWARKLLASVTGKGRIVRTSTFGGFVLLYLVASLRGLRRRSLRFQVEHGRIDQWLATIERLAVAQPALALEVARAQRLVRGYGDTHARGWRNFQRLMSALAHLGTHPQGAEQMQALTQAALADESGQSLEQMLATMPAAAGDWDPKSRH